MPDDIKQTLPAARESAKAVVVDSGLFHNFMDTSRFEHLQRVSKMFANSSLVPEHFRGKEADCFIAVEMAMRLQLHPFNLMQSLYVVHGKPGIEAKMAIALINSSGLFEAPLQWTISGEGMKRQAIARAVHAKSKQVCEATVTMEMAKAEGWIDKSGSKWKTMPDLMLQYRSASFFARLYCPEVIFGMQTREELQDAEIDVTPQPTQPEPATERPRSLRDRVIQDAEPVQPTPAAAPRPAEKTTEQLVAEGHIVIHDEKPQEPAGATGGAEGGLFPSEGAKSQPVAPSDGDKGPTERFESAMKHAKSAKTKGEIDIVADLISGPGYTEAQREEVMIVLRSKKV